MYIGEDIIEHLAEEYGLPEPWHTGVLCYPDEFGMICASQRDGRNHDVTVYIRKGEKLVVNAKHFYPPGLYRAPSGGVHRNENFLAGVYREMFEETGCEIELKRFLLRTDVTFYKMMPDAEIINEERINWRSLVFLADFIKGDFKFSDRHEIREVALVNWADFDAFSRIMRRTAIGGFHYRAALHDQVRRIISE